MQTAERNAIVVSRRMEGDSFAAIARDHGITRERARQLFQIHATPDQVRVASTVAAPEPVAVAIDPAFPPGPRVKLHVSLAAPTALTSEAIRAGIRRWLDGDLTLVETQPGTASRVDIRMAASMRDEIAATGRKASKVIRGVIAALERNNP